MGIASQDAVEQLSALMDQVDGLLKVTFQNMHQGHPTHTVMRFLKAREWSVPKAHKMLLDSLNWRIQNQIDDILSKPITPADRYRGIRDSQLVGLSGYSKQGLPVFAIGAGLSTFDKASVNYYVQSHIQMNEYRDRVVLPDVSKKYGRHIGTCLKVLDMTGLKFSALSHLKAGMAYAFSDMGASAKVVSQEWDAWWADHMPAQLLSIIATIDDLNYPEKTETYYIANAPYIFSACWKVVKPLLQERTRRKIQVLQGCGRDELLKIMDYASLPHFCTREGSGSSRYSSSGVDCYSLDHPFHQQLYSYTKQEAQEDCLILKQGSFHVDVPEPDPEGTKIVETIESELHKIGDRNGLKHSLSGLKIDSP